MKQSIEQDIVSYYDETLEDYFFWSKDYNMHFGYYNFFKTNPFKRDTMLNEMNEQVMQRLNINTAHFKIVDLGCGMGATMRHILKEYPEASITGLTLSSFQEKEGNVLLKNKNGKIIVENYNETCFESNTFDGAYALESFCHSGHSYKSMEETYRIIKPRAKFVMADAFLKNNPKSLKFTSKYCFNKLCEGWKLEGLGDVKTITENLKSIGFKNIQVEDISFKVAPSVMHVPFAITGFMIKKKLKREPIKPQSFDNLKGSLFALLSGLHLTTFGYYYISAEK